MSASSSLAGFAVALPFPLFAAACCSQMHNCQSYCVVSWSPALSAAWVAWQCSLLRRNCCSAECVRQQCLMASVSLLLCSVSNLVVARDLSVAGLCRIACSRVSSPAAWSMEHLQAHEHYSSCCASDDLQSRQKVSLTAMLRLKSMAVRAWKLQARNQVLQRQLLQPRQLAAAPTCHRYRD